MLPSEGYDGINDHCTSIPGWQNLLVHFHGGYVLCLVTPNSDRHFPALHQDRVRECRVFFASWKSPPP